MPIRVLVVDDSAVVRQVISGILNEDPGIRVIAIAADPLFAMEKMKREWPDVIVMDVEMPRMDGITFLRRIMAERPTPVVICSTLAERGAETTVEAMEAGAVNVITKPRLGVKAFLEDASADLVGAVKEAAHARVSKLRPAAPPSALPVAQHTPAKLNADAILPPVSHTMVATTEKIVAIGTSTGGTQALEVLLTSLPRVCPGIVIVQHMPEKFTASFAERLDSLCEIEVREARSNDRVVPGLALIAPGGRHMLVKRSGAQYVVEVVDGPLVNRHRPSVDVLFRSVARFAGRNALGILMTGMGDDGARGLKEMHDAGAGTIAQDEESCVVFGMPREAIKLGAADRVLPLQALAGAITALH